MKAAIPAGFVGSSCALVVLGSLLCGCMTFEVNADPGEWTPEEAIKVIQDYQRAITLSVINHPGTTGSMSVNDINCDENGYTFTVLESTSYVTTARHPSYRVVLETKEYGLRRIDFSTIERLERKWFPGLLITGLFGPWGHWTTIVLKDGKRYRVEMGSGTEYEGALRPFLLLTPFWLYPQALLNCPVLRYAEAVDYMRQRAQAGSPR